MKAGSLSSEETVARGICRSGENAAAHLKDTGSEVAVIDSFLTILLNFLPSMKIFCRGGGGDLLTEKAFPNRIKERRKNITNKTTQSNLTRHYKALV